MSSLCLAIGQPTIKLTPDRWKKWKKNQRQWESRDVHLQQWKRKRTDHARIHIGAHINRNIAIIFAFYTNGLYLHFLCDDSPGSKSFINFSFSVTSTQIHFTPTTRDGKMKNATFSSSQTVRSMWNILIWHWSTTILTFHATIQTSLRDYNNFFLCSCCEHGPRLQPWGCY